MHTGGLIATFYTKTSVILVSNVAKWRPHKWGLLLILAMPPQKLRVKDFDKYDIRSEHIYLTRDVIMKFQIAE